MLEYIILGFLIRQETSGYELKQRIGKSISHFFDASFGSIYPALKRLEAKGQITSREIVENGKYKIIYSVLDEGRQAFREWLDRPVDFVKTRHDHLVRIFFFDQLKKEDAEAYMRDLKRQVEPLLRELEEIRAKADSVPGYCEQYLYRCSTIDYGIRYYEFIIGWCDDLLNHKSEV